MTYKQTLGDRMKLYEFTYDSKLLPNAYFVVRLDGRGFSKYTRKMKFEKPFDLDLVTAMQNVTKQLVKLNKATIGYTQSDEITLVFNPKQTMFSGRIQKITSTLSAQCSVLFNREIEKLAQNNKLKVSVEQAYNLLPTFDCRVFSVPTPEEALNAVLWREQDAVKNSIQVLAQSLFSHKELNKLNGKKLQQKMLLEKDVNWNDLPAILKRGSYFIPVKYSTEVNLDNIEEVMTNIEYAEEKYDKIKEQLLQTGFIVRNNIQLVEEINLCQNKESVTKLLTLLTQ